MSDVRVDEGQVRVFAAHLRSSDEAKPFDFCSTSEGVIYPARSMPGVIDYYFFCAAHQFGFWTLAGDRYDKPMVAPLDGIQYKGSDYVWRCATKAWATNAAFFSPAHTVTLSDADWVEVFSDDEGRNPLPMWEEHLEIIKGYSRWFAEKEGTPEKCVGSCNASEKPLAALVSALSDMPGYCEDELQKKLFLLAIILENRPEGFLKVSDPDSYEPIIDYHLQRSALRTGLVRVGEGDLRARLLRRELVSAAEEAEVRRATFEAIKALEQQSGASVAAIDYFFFLNRRRCPEMNEPDCDLCPVNGICAHETVHFQPVFRTTDY